MQNDWGMAIAMGLLGLACMWPVYGAVRALSTGRLYVKLRYRPGRYHSRKTTPFGFWLGIAGCFAFGLFGVFCLVVSGLAVHRAMMMSASAKQPDAPSGVRCYSDVVMVPVELQKGEEASATSYQAMQFVRLRNGEIVAPILHVVRPNYRGFMGGVRHDPVWETTYHALGEGQAHLIMPVGEEIAGYIVLVRRTPTREEPGQDPWRVWIAQPQEASESRVMPAFESMELLSQREDGDELLRKYDTAKTFAESLRK